MPRYPDLPQTLGELRKSKFSEQRLCDRSVKDEMRDNLICRMQRGETLFPGVIGYDDTVVPQISNAILSRHNFILLGLRGQAKSRILRELTLLLDPYLPFIAGTEIHDNPYAPLSREGRLILERDGEATAIDYLAPDERYVEKLATPDVTIADMIGDIDPIKAARAGRELSDEMTMHYGLLPRANRGIFAVNELPDLASKVQVGLFNILQEGDVQIKGYPVRLRLDVLLTFSANPEDYTARGKIITPLKDRMGSEVRTHYPRTRHEAMAITSQEAWLDRTARAPAPLPVDVPRYIREIVEEIAFHARADQKVDRRSGISQRLPITTLETVVSNAERRALINGEPLAVPRVSDIYAALPSLTGKIELEYEGELKGAEPVARELVRQAVGTIFDGYATQVDTTPIVEWFEQGGSLDLSDTVPAASLLKAVGPVHGLETLVTALGVDAGGPAPIRASGADFVLEGLSALKRISRTDGGRLFSEPVVVPRKPHPEPRGLEQLMEDDEDEPTLKGKKKYYN
jgi:magnesium chelatase subunit I